MNKIIMKDYKISVNQRVIEAINYIINNNIAASKTEIATLLGVKANKFSEILGQRMSAGLDIIQNLCTKFNVSSEWILLGKGEMLKIEKTQDPQLDETLSPENNDQIADFKKKIAELEATIQTLITSNNALIATNKQLVNTIDRLTSDSGAPGNAMLIKTTKTTNGSIQPVIHVADLDNTKYQARKKRLALKK